MISASKAVDRPGRGWRSGQGVGVESGTAGRGAVQPFTTDEALTAGVTRQELRGPRFRRLARGVHVAADVPDSLLLRCQGLSLVLPADAAFSGLTAAALHGLPLPSDPRLPPVPAVIEARVADPGSVPRLSRVRTGSLWIGTEVVQCHGVRVTSLAHTWVELAGRLRHGDAVAVGDALLARGVDRPELEAATESRAGRRGVRRLRAVLADVRSGVDSPRETQLRLLLLRAGLPEPACGQDVVDELGQWLARPDLSWARYKVIAEYDGRAHHLTPDRWQQDLLRREQLERAGWIVIVITARDLERPERVAARVADALRRRGHTP